MMDELHGEIRSGLDVGNRVGSDRMRDRRDGRVGSDKPVVMTGMVQSWAAIR